MTLTEIIAYVRKIAPDYGVDLSEISDQWLGRVIGPDCEAKGAAWRLVRQALRERPNYSPFSTLRND